MIWPEMRKRIYNLWSQAYHPSSNPNEAANARAMLAELQTDLNISDVEVAFIAESEEKKPASSDDSERLPDVFELLVHLFDKSGIILTFPQVVIVALWILFTYIVSSFLIFTGMRRGCFCVAISRAVEKRPCFPSYISWSTTVSKATTHLRRRSILDCRNVRAPRSRLIKWKILRFGLATYFCGPFLILAIVTMGASRAKQDSKEAGQSPSNLAYLLH